MTQIRDSNGQIMFGGRELFEGEESVLQPIGSLARAIDRMSFKDFAWFMILLAKRDGK